MGNFTAYPPLHTAEHLITQLLHSRYPTLRDFQTRLKSRKCVVSFHYEGTIAEADRAELEAALQAISAAQLPVSEHHLPRTEAAARLPNLHQIPEEVDPVRVVRVGDESWLADERACIGQHVAHTGEIQNPRLPTLREEAPDQWRLNLVVG